ncbi:MAG: hypothetical protein SCJ94_08965 [Bacillota bacterium]|nr:hypothetical protein [Bacillota bacterium]
MNILEAIFPNIVALEPYYSKDGGNATRIYTASGEIIIDKRRIRTVLKQLARHYNADVAYLRQKYGKIVNCNLIVPLPLSLHLVLVPLKMRLPKFEQDGATGYINACAVTRIEASAPPAGKAGSRCLVTLTGGFKLTCYISLSKMEERLSKSDHALTHFKELHRIKKPDGKALVMEQASADALNKVATASRLLYEMLVGHATHSIACEKNEGDY